MQTGAANYADNNIKFDTWRGFWVTTVCPWTAWPDVMSWCSSVFCLLWKVWHDFPSAVFAKVRQFRLIPHCLKWVNEMQGSLKVFHAPGWTPFEIQPRLLAPYKGETTPMLLQSLPRTRWCTYRAGGPCGEWIAGINTSQLMMMANIWRKAVGKANSGPSSVLYFLTICFSDKIKWENISYI